MGTHQTEVIRTNCKGFTYLYDLTSISPNTRHVNDRLVAAYGRSIENTHARDKNRMRSTLRGGIPVDGKGSYDKGHAIAHAMGGGLDINLFPQRPDLNQGRSLDGKRYREMEKYASKNVGTFVMSRFIYHDNSWVPAFLEYGLLMKDWKLWVEWFEN
jgi:hypothetical protein